MFANNNNHADHACPFAESDRNLSCSFSDQRTGDISSFRDSKPTINVLAVVLGTPVHTIVFSKTGFMQAKKLYCAKRNSTCHSCCLCIFHLFIRNTPRIKHVKSSVLTEAESEFKMIAERETIKHLKACLEDFDTG